MGTITALTRLRPVALKILVYLNTHRDAQDTIEGIAGWWLLEQRIRQVTAEVKRALAELVATGVVLERSGRDGRVTYRLNPRKRVVVAQHLRQAGLAPAQSSLGPRSNNSR